ETLSTRFDSAANLLTSYGGLVDGANGLVTSSVSLVGQGSKDAQQLRTQLGQVATETGNIKSAVANANQALQGAFNASTTALNSVNAAADQVSTSSGQSVSAVVTSLNQQASGLQAQATNYQKVRDNLATLIAQLPDPTRAQGVLTSLDGIIGRLNGAATSLQSAATQISNKSGDSQASITEAKNLIGQAKTELSGLKTTVDTNIAPQANQLAADLAQVSDGLGQVRESVSTSLGGSGAGSLQAKLTQMKTNLDGAAKDLSAAGAQMKTLSEKLRGAIDSGDLAQVQKIIGDDPQRLAQALTTPAVVERHPIYAVENFGSSMAPLYATVAMWMGTMLIGVVVRAQPVSNVSKLRPSQVFFGRWGIFATIGLAQATLVAGGLLLFLDVQSVHPWLFMITAWLTAIVFSLINYSFVAAFGNVGKAISILFLVMQVSGAGGSFPLAILPGFLSELSPYLPAKPVINALRCGVAGYSGNEYLGHIGHLLLFIIPALIIGLVLRPILARRNQANSEAVESTKVLG
ncbi:MAG: YhgE/Pip domain-containing protein, partial [Actinomyces graevenitzii]|nr:YhgE/Pip domain-containing protein [Actinomyces graevenitzii]